jgi:hypothetical protein
MNNERIARKLIDLTKSMTAGRGFGSPGTQDDILEKIGDGFVALEEALDGEIDDAIKSESLSKQTISALKKQEQVLAKMWREIKKIILYDKDSWYDE